MSLTYPMLVFVLFMYWIKFNSLTMIYVLCEGTKIYEDLSLASYTQRDSYAKRSPMKIDAIRWNEQMFEQLLWSAVHFVRKAKETSFATFDWIKNKMNSFQFQLISTKVKTPCRWATTLNAAKWQWFWYRN